MVGWAWVLPWIKKVMPEYKHFSGSEKDQFMTGDGIIDGMAGAFEIREAAIKHSPSGNSGREQASLWHRKMIQLLGTHWYSKPMVFRRNRYYPHGDHRLTDQIDSQWIACPFTSACQTLAKHQKCSTSQKFGSTGLRLRDFCGAVNGFTPPKLDALKTACMRLKRKNLFHSGFTRLKLVSIFRLLGMRFAPPKNAYLLWSQ